MERLMNSGKFRLIRRNLLASNARNSVFSARFAGGSDSFRPANFSFQRNKRYRQLATVASDSFSALPALITSLNAAPPATPIYNFTAANRFSSPHHNAKFESPLLITSTPSSLLIHSPPYSTASQATAKPLHQNATPRRYASSPQLTVCNPTCLLPPSPPCDFHQHLHHLTHKPVHTASDKHIKSRSRKRTRQQVNKPKSSCISPFTYREEELKSELKEYVLNKSFDIQDQIRFLERRLLDMQRGMWQSERYLKEYVLEKYFDVEDDLRQVESRLNANIWQEWHGIQAAAHDIDSSKLRVIHLDSEDSDEVKNLKKNNTDIQVPRSVGNANAPCKTSSSEEVACDDDAAIYSDVHGSGDSLPSEATTSTTKENSG